MEFPFPYVLPDPAILPPPYAAAFGADCERLMSIANTNAMAFLPAPLRRRVRVPDRQVLLDAIHRRRLHYLNLAKWHHHAAEQGRPIDVDMALRSNRYLLAADVMAPAWELEDDRARWAYAQIALLIMPLYADAFVLMANSYFEQERWKDAYAVYVAGVHGGQVICESAGILPLREPQPYGYFWGGPMEYTRPYMRALHGMGITARTLGKLTEAIQVFQTMLSLNPSDNQGVRELLPVVLLEAGNDAGYLACAQRYRYYNERTGWGASPATTEPDMGMTWLFCDALAAFRRDGISAVAERALREAHGRHRHVVPFLLERIPLPDSNHWGVALGSPEEAAEFVRWSRPMWQATPGALDWLASVIGDDLPAPVPPTKRRGRR